MTAREEKGASVTDGEEIFIYFNVEFIYLFVQYSSASRVRIFSWPCKGGGEGGEQDEEQIKTISSLAEADDGESEFKPSHIYIYLNIYK